MALNDHKKKALINLLLHDTTAADLKELSEDLAELSDLACAREGHAFGDDQCGRPEHRYCYTCGAAEYRGAPQGHAREGKVNEPADSKSAVPGESPGSRSIFTRLWAWMARRDFG